MKAFTDYNDDFTRNFINRITTRPSPGILSTGSQRGATSEKIEMHFLKESDGLYRPVFCEVESPLEWPSVAVKYNLDETCDFEHYLQEQLLITGSIFLDSIIGQLKF